MTLLIVLLIAAFFGAHICGALACEARKSGMSNRGVTTVCVTCIIAAFVLTIVIIPSHHRVVDGSEHVAVFYTQEDKGRAANDMYYDADTNEYFIVGYSKWNPFNMSYRITVDNEEAERYVDAYNALQAENIFGG